MSKRTIIAIFVAFVLTIGCSALWSAETDGREGDTAANIISASDAPTGATDEASKKKGNRVARIFKAPFKAFGKLFGGGKKEGHLERLSPKDAERFESAAVTRVEDGRSDKADSSGTGGTARELLERGRALLEQGRVNDAIAELSRATSLDPKLGQAHSLLAVAYDRKGLHDRARESYERSIGASPEDAQALNNLGYSLYLNGNYRAAVERLKRAAKLAPTDARILNNLALAQCRLGKYNDAYKSFARAGGEFNGRLNTAALLERAGRDDDAITHYEAARRLQPSSTVVLRRLADLYQRAGRRDEADNARRAFAGDSTGTVATTATTTGN